MAKKNRKPRKSVTRSGFAGQKPTLKKGEMPRDGIDLPEKKRPGGKPATEPQPSQPSQPATVPDKTHDSPSSILRDIIKSSGKMTMIQKRTIWAAKYGDESIINSNVGDEAQALMWALQSQKRQRVSMV